MSQFVVFAEPEGGLYHHGILGMKWGKRNGPPYPLNYKDHSAAEKRAMKKGKSFGQNLSDSIRRHKEEKAKKEAAKAVLKAKTAAERQKSAEAIMKANKQKQEALAKEKAANEATKKLQEEAKNQNKPQDKPQEKPQQEQQNKSPVETQKQQPQNDEKKQALELKSQIMKDADLKAALEHKSMFNSNELQEIINKHNREVDIQNLISNERLNAGKQKVDKITGYVDLVGNAYKSSKTVAKIVGELGRVGGKENNDLVRFANAYANSNKFVSNKKKDKK